MRLQKEREMIVEYCQKMVTARLTTGTGGNMSFYNRETGEVAITPTGVDYFEMKAEDVLIMDIDENIIEGTRKPSSETAMHMTLYKKERILML